MAQKLQSGQKGYYGMKQAFSEIKVICGYLLIGYGFSQMLLLVLIRLGW